MDEQKRRDVNPGIESLEKAQEFLDDLLKRFGRIERHLIDLKQRGEKTMKKPLQ